MVAEKQRASASKAAGKQRASKVMTRRSLDLDRKALLHNEKQKPGKVMKRGGSLDLDRPFDERRWSLDGRKSLDVRRNSSEYRYGAPLPSFPVCPCVSVSVCPCVCLFPSVPVSSSPSLSVLVSLWLPLSRRLSPRMHRPGSHAWTALCRLARCCLACC